MGQLLVAALLVLPCVGNAASHYVRQAATGNGTGSDWTNACPSFTGSCAASSLVRGDTYYVAAGNYSATNFNTPPSGTSLITIKKATVDDHGTDTGWSAAYAGQAHFTASPLRFTSSYWVLDGVVGSGADRTSYGFVVDEGCGAIVIGTGVGTTYTTMTFSHIYALACSQDVEKLFLQTNFQMGQVDNLSVSYSLLDGWQNGMMARGNPGVVDNNWVFEHNLCLNGYSSSANHGEWINPNSAGFNKLIVRFTVFRGYSGSSGQTGTIVANNSNNNGAMIYGNVFDGLRVGNGVITGTSSGSLNNAVVYNNTFLNMTSDSGNAIGGTGQGSGNIAYNNLFYNTRASHGGGFIFDYNSYFSTTNTPTETHGQTTSGNPFVAGASGNYHLTQDTATWTSLSTPYNVDPEGIQRTSSRGAYQYASGSAAPSSGPPPPSGLTVTVR